MPYDDNITNEHIELKEKCEVILNSEITEKEIEDSNQIRMVIRIRETNKELKRAVLIKKIETYIGKDIGFQEGSFHTTGMFLKR
jgi:hypothetical protein